MAIGDPRVDALDTWARGEGRLSGSAADALAALIEAPSRPETAPAIARVAAAAYARVPGLGPRDIRTGNELVSILTGMGEAGARELLRLRESVRYKYPLEWIERALSALEYRIGTPLGELEDAFAGVPLDAELRAYVAVGPYEAILAVDGDLRRVHTTWSDPSSGRESARRPPQVAEFIEELETVENTRRRLRAHVTAVRRRFDEVMTVGRSWTIEAWAGRMLGDPLRSAMTRRLVWRVGADPDVLVLLGDEGLCDIDGSPVEVGAQDSIALWHPADDPNARDPWRRMLAERGIAQPIDQLEREVVLADPDSPRLWIAPHARLKQTPFRGFLRDRGWDVPYIGPFFFIGEAKRPMTRYGPTAVLELDIELRPWPEPDRVVVGSLAFRSVVGQELDARTLPPPIVSDAARDVLGAIAVSG